MSSKTGTTRSSRTRKEKALATRMLRQLREGKDARSRKIRRVGASIRAGYYENDLKLQIAMERMIESAR